jgi:tetratricopeptide (TPR) repeat protein
VKTGALLGVVALLAIAGTQRSVASSPQRPAEIKPIRGFERFQEWSRLVWTHTPGELDEAARAVAAWPPADLLAVRTDLWAAVKLIAGGAKRGAVAQYTIDGDWLPSTQMANPTARPRAIRSADLPDLLSLAGDRPMRELDAAAVTRFMKRAALLHTDIAVLFPAANELAAPRRNRQPASSALRIVDGEDKGWQPNPVHWDFGRTALDGVRPNPATDRFVSAWYLATSAYQGLRREYGFLRLQLERGRALFTKDALLLLYSGVMHEAHAAPLVQTALQSLSSHAFRPTVNSTADELKLAEGFFRRALDLDPGMTIARLHLGRVLGLQGRHKEAAGELRRAQSSLTDARQRYFAELFLGAEEQALGRAAEAIAAFQRARLLFPNAQSPYLALSQLAWQAADRTGAQLALESLAGLPAAPADREDPWWTYDVSAMHDLEVLISKLLAIAAEDLSK